jgi:acetyltransferase-like isoleucine patch superfamily enzyme
MARCAPRRALVQEALRVRLRLVADRLRACGLRLRGARLGRRVGVAAGVRVDRPWCIELGQRVRLEAHVHVKVVSDGARVVLGERVYLGPGSHLDVMESVSIGPGSLLGPYCVLVDHDHGTAPGVRIDGQPCTSAAIRLGDGVWLGAGVKVLKGVTIGEGAVVGAGAVVLRDLPAGAIAVGVPARVIGLRDPGPGAGPA